MAPAPGGPQGLTKGAGFWHSPHAVPPTPPRLTHVFGAFVCVLQACMSLHALIECVQDAKQKRKNPKLQWMNQSWAGHPLSKHCSTNRGLTNLFKLDGLEISSTH